MFTVIIAEKDFLDSIEAYSLFLKPLIDRNNLAFCEWTPDGMTFAEMVPELEETVSRCEKWRAVVLCGEEGLHRKNPFDLVEYTEPVREYEMAPGESAFAESDQVTGEAAKMDLEGISAVEGKQLDKKLANYLKALRKAKFSAFEQASSKPLTRLMTFLCEAPLVSNGLNDASADPEFSEYRAESARKAELRSAIKGGEQLTISLPAEILCIAKRTYPDMEYDIRNSWIPHEDLHYSKFTDRNMYFDKMRFLVFDILPKTHRNYSFDYIRYLFAVLLISENDLPISVVKPSRVYSVSCEDDEEALSELLTDYDAKLDATVESIEHRIKDITGKQQERLTDREAKSIFCSNVTIPVTIEKDIDRKEMFANEKAYGLSEDCASDEFNVWNEQLKGSKRTLRLLLKQPRRALKKATSDIRRLNEADCEKALILNEFQVEDIEENIAAEELRMVNTETVSVLDTDEFERQMDEYDKKIKSKIATRMTKGTTIALGVTVLLLFLLGFLPLLFGNLAEENSVIISAVVIGSAIFLMIAVLIICLFCLRRPLKKLIRGFNALMNSINTKFVNALTQFSLYLSHACNVMRGNSVLKYRSRNEPPDTLNVRKLRKHIVDIKTCKAEAHDILGKFAAADRDPRCQAEAYDYDFTRAVEYAYPLPYKSEDQRRIEFLQAGNYVTVPVKLVKRIMLRREELYDR